MAKYHEYISQKSTPQSQPIPGREADMVKNLAGGYAFQVTHWTRLERFLILGSEGGTYYVGARELTVQNAQSIRQCLKEDGKRTVDTIVGVSVTGRGAKNDPAILALAMASSPSFNNDPDIRKYALDRLSDVCRTGTHLFTFVEYVNEFRGWGRQLRNAVSNWYLGKTPEQLAYQMAKYQRRGGWSHHDVMHMAHPRAAHPAYDLLFQWAKNGWDDESMHGVEALVQLEGMELAKQAKSAREIVLLIGKYRLTREMIPNAWFGDPSVWEAMLATMPMTAMIRSLGKMSEVGLLAPLSSAAVEISSRLRNQDHIRAARVHPWTLLNAQNQYATGHGGLGSLKWIAVNSVVDAMEDAFELSFDNVIPTNKRILIALDVSGSMSHSFIADSVKRTGWADRGMKAAQAAAAMAMITARTEPNYHIVLFNTQAREAHIAANSSLRDVTRGIEGQIAGGTDYSAGIRYAHERKWEVDAFVVYGDEESWYGNDHTAQAVVKYRKDLNIPAKLVINNFCSTQTSVADPQDAGMANFVGMDTQTPRLISEFIRE